MGLSHVDRLTAIADNECVPFHDAHTVFAGVETNGHRETWPVRSRDFSLWLQHRNFNAHRGAPTRTALRLALDTIELQGRFGGTRQRVFRRVASLDNHLYLDLANSEWGAVEIGADGWRMHERCGGDEAHRQPPLARGQSQSLGHVSLGPVYGAPLERMKEALLGWYRAMGKAGLLNENDTSMEEFVKGTPAAPQC